MQYSDMYHTFLCVKVRFARSYYYVDSGTGPANNRQLFFKSAPVHVTEADLRTVFGCFGIAEEVVLFRDSRTGAFRGSGLVTMRTREEAMRALGELNGRHYMLVSGQYPIGGVVIGCVALVRSRMSTRRDSACLILNAYAIACALQGSFEPLTIKWADPDLRAKKQRARQSNDIILRGVRCCLCNGLYLAAFHTLLHSILCCIPFLFRGLAGHWLQP